jgi:hypothetical protein
MEAFEFWYGGDRTIQPVADRFNVSYQAVKAWATAFTWRDRAAERDAEVQRRLDREAINRKAQMLREHRMAGELARRRAVENLRNHAINETRDALAALKLGIEIERQVEQLPQYLLQVLEMNDDQALALQRQLMEAVERDRAGIVNESEAVSLVPPGETEPGAAAIPDSPVSELVPSKVDRSHA